MLNAKELRTMLIANVKHFIEFPNNYHNAMYSFYSPSLSDNFQFGEEYDRSIYFTYYTFYSIPHKVKTIISADDRALYQSTSNSAEGVILIHTSLFICGGYTDCSASSLDDTTYIIDPTRKLLKYLAGMVRKKAFHSMAYYSNSIYAIGGEDNGKFLTDFDCYNLNDNKWKECALLNVPRRRCASIANHEKIYVFGGEYNEARDDSAGVDISFEYYSYGVRSWVCGICKGPAGSFSNMDIVTPKWVTNNDVIVSDELNIYRIDVANKQSTVIMKYTEDQISSLNTFYANSKVGVVIGSQIVYISKQLNYSISELNMSEWNTVKYNIDIQDK